MLSIDLFDSRFEKKLHEGAVDDLEQHRIDVLNDRMQDLLARARTASPEMKAGLKQQYEKIKSERDSYYKIREAQQSSAKDLLKNKDLITPQQRVAGAMPAKPGMGAAVKDVVGGIKRFVKGEPDQGPTYEGVVQERQTQKKKSEENPVKDVKLSRAIQKARAKFPTANSNWEAYAKDNIETDSTQSTKIQNLSKELERIKKDNESLTAMVKNLGQEIKASPEPTATATPVAKEPAKDKETIIIKAPSKDKEPAKAKEPAKDKKPTPPATVGRSVEKPLKTYNIPTPAQLPINRKTSELPPPGYVQIGPNLYAPSQYEKVVRKGISKQAWNQDSKNITDVQFEHGGGIGPRQHWQDLMQEEEALIEGIRDTASATAVIACLLTGGSLTGCATAPQQTSAQQVLKTGQDIGRTVQSAKKITRAGTEAEVQQELRNILRGINRPEELNNSNIIRIWRRIQGQPPVQPEPQAPEYGPAEPVRRPATFEAKEIVSKEDFIRERDRLLRMISAESNPANKQILRSAIRQLENRAENEGWIAMQQRMVREDTASAPAEQAILKRIMVAHTDLLQQYGPDKVMQAAEEVAYNVGDVSEIGSSDVSGWVRQVEQILGARP